MKDIRIIGAGRAGRSFAGALQEVGYRVDGPYGHSSDLSRLSHETDILMLAVPDRAISETAGSIEPDADTLVVHLSGATSADALFPHPRRAVLHPFAPLPDPATGKNRLMSGMRFAVSGDVSVNDIVHDLGGRSIHVDDSARVLYHAAGCIAANHLVALMSHAGRVGALAGLDMEALLDLAGFTLDDIHSIGIRNALTGPASRGDKDTIARHLDALNEQDRAAYLAELQLIEQITGSTGIDLAQGSEGHDGGRQASEAGDWRARRGTVESGSAGDGGERVGGGRESGAQRSEVWVGGGLESEAGDGGERVSRRWASEAERSEVRDNGSAGRWASEAERSEVRDNGSAGRWARGLRRAGSSMEVVEQAGVLQRMLEEQRSAGMQVGLVPTMGALHEGHGSLIERAKRECDVVVATIFVNPLQFNDHTDLDRYPRTLDEDLDFCRERGADIVFAPGVGEMYPGYPAPPQSVVHVSGISDVLEGAFRPGHFDGVATVVAKLFAIAGRCRAYFGEKDYQQIAVVRELAREMLFPVEIVPCPTVREADGLAMSSRNRNLSPEMRKAALCLYRALLAGEKAIHSNVDVDVAKKVMIGEMEREKGVAVEYGEIVYADSLMPVESRVGNDGMPVRLLAAGNRMQATDSVDASDAAKPLRLLVAARVGDVRLIDNIGVRYDRDRRDSELA